MRGKLMFAVFIFAVLVGVSTVHAQKSDKMLWITGKVVTIEEGQTDSLISMELAGGEPFNVAVANDLLGDIKAGDVITVQIARGWAEMVEIAKGGDIPTPGPEKKDKGPQWVAGEVIAMQEDSTDSLISVKQWNGSVFNIAIASDKLEGLKLGDQVTVKILKGWAQTVTEKEN